MSLTINGVQSEVPAGCSIVELLQRLDVGSEKPGVAVAVNQTVVPRSAWPSTTLADDDRVEIIRPVQGG